MSTKSTQSGTLTVNAGALFRAELNGAAALAKDHNPNVTPMMAQYLEIKDRYPEAMLFYRMGDFYELFFDDAVQAAQALDIALTKRGKHLGNDIPMCGVPVHAAEGYLHALIGKGFRVGVCEQLEDPSEAKKRGSKSVVKRDVVRLVTPGTITEDRLLNARSHNFLAAFCAVRDDWAAAWCDLSTGDLLVTSFEASALSPLVARISPSEILSAENTLSSLQSIADDASIALTPLSSASFDSGSATIRLQKQFAVASLDAFGSFTKPMIGALGGIIDYLDITQRGQLARLKPPRIELSTATMAIDAATRRNLELTQSLSGGSDGTLISILDKTITGGGGRLLQQRLTAPLTDADAIADRHDAVSFFDDVNLRANVRTELSSFPDMERSLSRLALDRGGPRDLSAIRDGLARAVSLKAIIPAACPVIVSTALDAFLTDDPLANLLESALVAEPPLLKRDVGFVANGYDVDLDEARALRDEGRAVIAKMQQEFSDHTGISALKIKHNNVLGYFIETPASHAKKMLAEPLNETFIHRQTTANAVRFTTVELSSLETRILNAGARAAEIELRIFSTLRTEILDNADRLSLVAAAVAEIDVASGLMERAATAHWTRPKLDDSRVFLIEGGRHPVVEAALEKSVGAQFIPNDCDLSDDPGRVWLLTGPNMAGKSTFLRQNALIAVLAQMGSFVPATSAHIGTVDQLFSRVGAADDLARGRSTFMVEMVETAAILNQANDRALVILDEIGRGTATYDGLSIAWATLEHLHDGNGCRALFATHYHELTALVSQLDGLKNATVAVREWEGEVVFLHEVRPGAADRSYGVQVAQLAGLPPAVVKRARHILDMLESGDQKGSIKPEKLLNDLPLFSLDPVANEPAPTAESELALRMKDVLPDSLSPREALDLIYELKTLSED